MVSLSLSTQEQAIFSLASNCPIGELPEVLSNVRLLSNDKDIVNKALQDKKFHNLLLSSHFEKISGYINPKPSDENTFSSTEKFIVSPSTRISEDSFFHSSSGKTFKILLDANTPTVREGSRSTKYSTKETISIEGAVSKFVSSYFSHSHLFAVSSLKIGSKTVVIVSGQRLNSANLQSASFCLNMQIEKSCASTELKIWTHNFEGGNVQLHYDWKFSRTFNDCSEGKVVGHIEQSLETSFKSLDKYFSKVKEESLETMRRLMPITKEKIDWRSFMNQMNSGIGEYK